MSVTRYTVKPGDTLSQIAGSTLGNRAQWRRIWRYNNRSQVVRVTGRSVPNPDLIYPGQVLLIPALPGQAPVQGEATREAAVPVLADELKNIASPLSIKYRLDDLRFPRVVQSGVVVELRMTGDVLLMSQRVYPALYVTERQEIEAQVVSQANHAFGALVNDCRLVYDSSQNTLTYRSMLVSQSSAANGVASAVGIQTDMQNPIPKLRFEFRFPKLSGAIPPFHYSAVDVKIVVELSPDTPAPVGSSPQEPRALPRSWDRLIGAGIIAGAVVLVAGTLIEDFFTAGGGVVDDPASFAAASAGIMRGLRLLRASTVLPAAALPTALPLSVRLATSYGTRTLRSHR
jgi:hypothetical protein